MFYVIILFCSVTFQSKCWCSELTKLLKSNNFIEIRQSTVFIDKTLLIYKTINNDEPVFFSSPPGFGRSTNLDMIRVFLSNTVDYKVAQEMFADTNIAKDSYFVKTNLGQHPVIHCSFEPLSSVTDYNTMVANFRSSLHKAFSQHEYLTSSKLLAKDDLDRFTKFIDAESYTSLEPSEISSGLHFLSKALTIHHSKPVFLLIDDFDSVIWESLMTPSLGIREVLGFYDTVLNKVLTNKENFKKVILTGTSCMLFKLLPSSGNIQCVDFLHDKNFEPFFGLTGDEVDHLADQSVYVNLRPNLTEWFDGYTSPDLSAHIYNTKSFMSFIHLSKGELKSFWSNAKVQKFLRILLQDRVRKSLLLESPENLMFVVRELKEVNEGLLEGVKNMINQEMYDAGVSDSLIYLLADQGYFTFNKPWERSGYNTSVTFKLANLDVCGHLKKFVSDYIQEMKKKRANVNIQ